MDIPSDLHAWNVSADEAFAIQRELAARVIREGNGAGAFRLIAGVDAAFSADGEFCLSCIVVWDRERREIVETVYGEAPPPMPYIPGLLSFREVPAVLDAVRKLETVPDAFMCDGQGIAHPRRIGIASHLGVLLDMPSVGCAKSRLTGGYREPAPERGSISSLRDRGEVIGAVVRTRDGVKPLFISTGHRMGLETAVELVLACGAGLRLPEPTRLADRLVGEYKRSR